MLFSIWGNAEQSEFTLTEGAGPHPGDTPGLVKVNEFRADTREDAVRIYNQYLDSLPED